LIAQTIESVLAQTYSAWELIIIDDGSMDNTAEVVKQYEDKDSRIKYFFQENKGTPAARNVGIRMAKGKYLAFLDSDDLYFPNALQNLWEYFRLTPPKTKLVYGDFTIFYDNSNATKQIYAAPPRPRPKLYFQFLISEGNPIVPSAAMAEKDAITDLGMFDESFSPVEDAELWSRLILQYDIAKIETQIVRYRKHEIQLTKSAVLRRYGRDRLSLKLFNSLKLPELFPNVQSDHEMAMQLDRLAKIMLKRDILTYDTALHVLKLAQETSFRARRERFINKLEAGIKGVLDKSVLPA
jgi:glycosyltransferase involved in cell wall biosynthesis